MDYSEYLISESGVLSYRIAVPCFIGEKGEFYTAARMNRFYSTALSEMHGYVSSRPGSNVRRRSYTCTFCVNESDGGGLCVTLFVLERLVPNDGSRSQTMKKEITHVWRDGVIIKKSVR